MSLFNILPNRLPKLKTTALLHHPRLQLLKIALILILLVLIFSAYKLTKHSTSSLANKQSDQKITTSPAKETMEINRDFNFPLLNDKDEEISKIKFTIQSAEIRDEIILKGQKATAVSGRSFLVLNIKITNETKKGLNINTRNYVRLSTNGNDKELLAPDIHNDPVEVQAISTKLTRLGFPINTTDKALKLKIGDINGEKSNIDLNFQKK